MLTCCRTTKASRHAAREPDGICEELQGERIIYRFVTSLHFEISTFGWPLDGTPRLALQTVETPCGRRTGRGFRELDGSHAVNRLVHESGRMWAHTGYRRLGAKAPASHGNWRSNSKLASWAVSGGASSGAIDTTQGAAKPGSRESAGLDR